MSDYRGFLIDFISEVVELTKDESLYSAGDVYSTGYRAALYSVLHLLDEQAKAWELDVKEVGLGNFSPDKWRQEGQAYWSE